MEGREGGLFCPAVARAVKGGLIVNDRACMRAGVRVLILGRVEAKLRVLSLQTKAGIGKTLNNFIS